MISYYKLLLQHSDTIIALDSLPTELSSIQHDRNPYDLFHWHARRNTCCFMIPFLFQKI